MQLLIKSTIIINCIDYTNDSNVINNCNDYISCVLLTSLIHTHTHTHEWESQKVL